MNLQLSLITKYFDQTKQLIKLEDYREITPYWVKRLTQYDKNQGFSLDSAVNFLKNNEQDNFKKNFHYLPSFCFPKKFDYNIMTLGYPLKTDTARILKFKHAGIEIRTGNPAWGAEPNKLYFVVKHGEVVK